MTDVTTDATRRMVLTGTTALVLTSGLGLPAIAEPADMEREIKTLIGSAVLKPGRVKIELPDLTENGNSTSLTIVVASPMTAADYVRAVHIFSEKNPVPYVARLGIGPRAGRAKVATSIRLADSQTITAVAEMSDGSFWSGQAATEVTAPACIDDSDRKL